MPDVRDLLERAAPWPTEGLDVEALRRRAGRRVARRRWAAGGSAMVVAALVAAAVAVGTGPDRSGSVQVATRPATSEPAQGPLLTDAGVVPVAAAGPRPERIVGATKAGSLVVVDARTGSTLVELVRSRGTPSSNYSDGPPPNVIGDVALSQDGRTVHFTSVGEPACGNTRRVAVSGGGVTDQAGGDFVSASPDGRHLATSGCFLTILPGAAGATAGTAEPGTGGAFGAVAWSADGRYVAIERQPDPPAGAPAEILVLDLLTARGVADALVLRDPEGVGYRFPAFRRDGSLVVAQQRGRTDAVARVVDPRTGALLASFAYGGPVQDQSYDATHTWPLVTMGDGSLRWFGAGQQGAVAGQFTAADW